LIFKGIYLDMGAGDHKAEIGKARALSPKGSASEPSVQNIVEFHIIGRLGRIDAAKKVTHISVATNYNPREGETCMSDPQWHRITLFDKMRDRLTNATIGDLVRITGRIGQSKNKVDGHTVYSVDLVAHGFAILVKAKMKTLENDMQG
jgi:single-strand DNA-binding protein